jgi:beta-1,4-mannosyl-glycoprotein beta-1,4-N-acetylglucosaminyltransferase
MVYDTFPFFNELELLEARLAELDPVVDRFVLAEATRTHSNKPKPLHFQENRQRFAPFLSKIIHLVVDDCPDSANAWVIEKFQRDAVGRGLVGCRPDDIIMNSDVDEIPRASSVRWLREQMRFGNGPGARFWSTVLRQNWVVGLARNLFKKRHPRVWLFEHRQFYHFLNCTSRTLPWWDGTRAVFFRDFTRARDLRSWKGRRIPDAGWHFSYMGGVDRVREKLQAFAHQEYNRPEYVDRQKVEEALREGRWALGPEHRLEFVPFDGTFPEFLQRNRERFQDWVGEVPARADGSGAR